LAGKRDRCNGRFQRESFAFATQSFPVVWNESTFIPV
jgi:hypothetical protein